MMNKRTRAVLRKVINESSSVGEILLKLDLHGYNYPKNKPHLCKYLYGLVYGFGTDFHQKFLFLKKWQEDNLSEIANVEIIRSWYSTRRQLPLYADTALKIWKDKLIKDFFSYKRLFLKDEIAKKGK